MKTNPNKTFYCRKKFKQIRNVFKLNFRCTLFTSLSTILVDNDVNKVHLKFPFDAGLICLKFFLH